MTRCPITPTESVMQVYICNNNIKSLTFKDRAMFPDNKQHVKVITTVNHNQNGAIVSEVHTPQQIEHFDFQIA